MFAINSCYLPIYVFNWTLTDTLAINIFQLPFTFSAHSAGLQDKWSTVLYFTGI